MFVTLKLVHQKAFQHIPQINEGASQWCTGKNPPAMRETQVQSLGQEDPWRRKWQQMPVLLPGKPHGQRRLASYSLWGHRV